MNNGELTTVVKVWAETAQLELFDIANTLSAWAEHKGMPCGLQIVVPDPKVRTADITFSVEDRKIFEQKFQWNSLQSLDDVLLVLTESPGTHAPTSFQEFRNGDRLTAFVFRVLDLARRANRAADVDFTSQVDGRFSGAVRIDEVTISLLDMTPTALTVPPPAPN